ncbi:MAG: phenylalanyl-tRNA synthetase alpha chain [Parcubacteria group bacterium Athens1014_10]|nr:MAG: phenylalanyl-tRNA synthetase alpha chain [Parcubacteria group bacterium Athens1014_10]
MIKDSLNKIKDKAMEEIKNVSNFDLLEKIQKKYLGRKEGELTKILKNLKNLSLEEKKVIGKLANEVKLRIESEAKKKIQELKIKAEALEENFDITLPGEKIEIGHLHPLTQFTRKITDVFVSMGFEIVDGPEAETEEYNFDLLNIPKEHPSRDLWDTFYIKSGNSPESPELDLGSGDSEQNSKNKLLLRTHTSPVQLRAMEKRKPPVRLIMPGRVFRHEATDAGHETTFHQLEGLVIGENIKMTDLIGTLQYFVKTIFGESAKIRVRPNFFPFTEPSIEVDMTCLICCGKGCGFCGGDGWIETLGAGMVHPAVLKNMKIDPNKYSGFAFGMGVDRLMMLYYGVNDIRLSYSGDLRFIKQF